MFFIFHSRQPMPISTFLHCSNHSWKYYFTAMKNRTTSNSAQNWVTKTVNHHTKYEVPLTYSQAVICLSRKNPRVNIMYVIERMLLHRMNVTSYSECFVTRLRAEQQLMAVVSKYCRYIGGMLPVSYIGNITILADVQYIGMSMHLSSSSLDMV